MDGDDRPDQVVYDPSMQELVVCTAAGHFEHLPWQGMGEVLEFGDVQPDGRQEVFFGGTTVSAAAADVATWHDGQLRAVTDASGERLTLWRGGRGEFDAVTGTFSEYRDWGCVDVAGDVARELLSGHAVRQGDHYELMLTAYTIRGSRAVVVERHRRSIRSHRELHAPVDGTC